MTQQGSTGVPGGIDAARLARMGGFGLLFYGPYQCATPPASLETTSTQFLQGEKPLQSSAGFTGQAATLRHLQVLLVPSPGQLLSDKERASLPVKGVTGQQFAEAPALAPL